MGVMVDGSPNVMIAPYLFTEHFHTLDDYTQRPYFTAFVRLLRLAAFFLTVLLPGYYVAVVTFHPERIPRMLLPAFLGSVSATPLSAMGEALVLFCCMSCCGRQGCACRMPLGIPSAWWAASSSGMPL